MPAVRPGARGGGRGARAGGGGSKAKQPTLGAQFKKQLATLMDTLNDTMPHFVRCMKSNDQKKGDIFNSSRMLDQLRYAGLLEVCRIRQVGFPVRKEFSVFFNRYRCLVDGAKDIDELTKKLKAAGILDDSGWAEGKSKVFLKNPQAARLEQERETAFVRQAQKVQKHVRALLLRVQFARFKSVLDGVRAAVAARDGDKLEHWMDMCAELPGGGAHMGTVRGGRALLQRLQEERAICKEGR
jgi:myosin heavy subunit